MRHMRIASSGSMFEFIFVMKKLAEMLAERVRGGAKIDHEAARERRFVAE